MNEITLLSEEKARILWNEFIQSASDMIPFTFNPSFFDFYSEHFHWKPLYFFLYSDERPIGILPLVYTGKTYASLPHFSYGGLYTNQQVYDVGLVIQRLVKLIDKESLVKGYYSYNLPSEAKSESNSSQTPLFLRSLNPFGMQTVSEKITSFIELSATKDELWHRLSSNLRRKIRRAEKCGATFQQGGEELLRDFYKVYSRKMHQLGSPPYGKIFFRMFFHGTMKEEAAFFVSYFGQRPVGAALLLSYNGFYESAWFATEPAFQKYYISDGLHWAMVKHVIKKGGKIYSMGRSTKNRSVYVYKNHWPVKNQPLFIYNSANLPSLKKHGWLSVIWKWVPLPVANWLGPKFVKHIY